MNQSLMPVFYGAVPVRCGSRSHVHRFSTLASGFCNHNTTPRWKEDHHNHCHQGSPSPLSQGVPDVRAHLDYRYTPCLQQTYRYSQGYAHHVWKRETFADTANLLTPLSDYCVLQIVSSHKTNVVPNVRHALRALTSIFRLALSRTYVRVSQRSEVIKCVEQNITDKQQLCKKHLFGNEDLHEKRADIPN